MSLAYIDEKRLARNRNKYRGIQSVSKRAFRGAIHAGLAEARKTLRDKIRVIWLKNLANFETPLLGTRIDRGESTERSACKSMDLHSENT